MMTGISLFAQMSDFGYLKEFTLTDDLGDPRNVQVFIPNSYDYKVPARVLWYFRGTNGVYITYNIETTHLYQVANLDGVVVVAPDLYQKTWSRGDSVTDFKLIKDVIQQLSQLRDKDDRLLNLNLNLMSACGFSGGAGFIYHIAGKYLQLFNADVFRKYLAHSKPLELVFNDSGVLVGGNTYDKQAFNDMKEGFSQLSSLPLFQLSVGTSDFFSVDQISDTRDHLLRLGLDVSFFAIDGMNHRFLVDFSPQFKDSIRQYFYPIRITSPTKGITWRLSPWGQKEFNITWDSARTLNTTFSITLTPVAGRNFPLGENIPNTGSYTVDASQLPEMSGEYYLKMKSADKHELIYSKVFNIEMIPVNVSITGERGEDRAWLISKSYVKLDVSIKKIKSTPLSKVVVYRKEDGGSYIMVDELAVTDDLNESFTVIDKTVFRDINYTYKAVALDPDGNAVTESDEFLI